MLKTLRYRAISGIISAILLVPTFILGDMYGAKSLSSALIPLYYVLLPIVSLSYIYFQWGFKIIGYKTKNKLLIISTILTIIFSVLSYLLSFLQTLFTHLVGIIIGIAVIVICGAVTIPFGIGLLRLKDKLGNVAKAAGVLNIISGACLITVLGIFIAILILIPLIVFEIIVMFKASEKL